MLFMGEGVDRYDGLHARRILRHRSPVQESREKDGDSKDIVKERRRDGGRGIVSDMVKGERTEREKDDNGGRDEGHESRKRQRSMHTRSTRYKDDEKSSSLGQKGSNLRRDYMDRRER